MATSAHPIPTTEHQFESKQTDHGTNDIKSDTPVRYRYLSPCDDTYSVFRQGKWVSIKQTKLAPTYISRGIDMLGSDIYDERPWADILADAKKNNRKTLPCVIHIAYCQGRPVKMNSNVKINNIVVEKY